MELQATKEHLAVTELTVPKERLEAQDHREIKECLEIRVLLDLQDLKETRDPKGIR